MPIASSYPFLDVVWTMIVFFGFVVWLWILFAVLADVFRRGDLSGWGKAGWIVFMVLLPYLGVFVYLIKEQSGMSERALSRQEAAQAKLGAQVQSASPGEDPSAQIAKGKTLLDEGTITPAEFERIKHVALAA